MLFPNMSSLLWTKERLPYSVFSTLIRAFHLSSHRTNFEKFENKSKNHFKSTSSEGKSVKFEKLRKWTSLDEINERFKKANERLQAANLEGPINFDNTEKSDVHEMFGNLSEDDHPPQSIMEMETYELEKEHYRSTAELENFHTHILMYAAKRFAYTPPVYKARSQLAAIDYNEHIERPAALTKEGKKMWFKLTDTEVQELSIKFYLCKSSEGRQLLEGKGQIQEDLKKIDAMILSKRQGKQMETKVSMPGIDLCNKVLISLGLWNIGSMEKAFEMYELMLQHGPEPNDLTYMAIIQACVTSLFSSREEILKIAKKLLRDIQDRGIQIHDPTHKALMNLFATGIDSKILIYFIPFLLDEVGEKHSGRILSFVLNSSLFDRQRGFHDAICAWRLIACRKPSIKPTSEDFRTLLLITYHCDIANEDEFQRMLQKTAYPCSNEEFWNDSKKHEVKNNYPFAVRNERDEMDLNKDEHTRCTLGTNNSSNAEGQLKKSTQIELSEMVELFEMDTRQEKEMITSSNHLSFPLNVKREHKISDILNPFETVPNVISLPGRVTSEDRESLLDGIKEFRIGIHDVGGLDHYWFKKIAIKTPMTIAIEPSLLRLSCEKKGEKDTSYGSDKGIQRKIVTRIYLRRDHAAAKEVWRFLEQSGNVMLTRKSLRFLCGSLDNERDVFHFLHFMQTIGNYPDIRTFGILFYSPWATYDLSYQKKLLMEMSWLNICPNEKFLRQMNERILEINSEMLKQENSSNDVEYTDKPYISREEFENFVTFYHEWLTMYNL